MDVSDDPGDLRDFVKSALPRLPIVWQQDSTAEDRFYSRMALIEGLSHYRDEQASRPHVAFLDRKDIRSSQLFSSIDYRVRCIQQSGRLLLSFDRQSKQKNESSSFDRQSKQKNESSKVKICYQLHVNKGSVGGNGGVPVGELAIISAVA
jgi:hypothetical protein